MAGWGGGQIFERFSGRNLRVHFKHSASFCCALPRAAKWYRLCQETQFLLRVLPRAQKSCNFCWKRSFYLARFRERKSLATFAGSAPELSDAPQSQDEFTISLNHFRKVNRVEFGVWKWTYGLGRRGNNLSAATKRMPYKVAENIWRTRQDSNL